jgi:peptidoglycan/LPS O-acetylase OafA/YrhL
VNQAHRSIDSLHRRTELDGLRALAVLGVMYTHFVNGNSTLGTLGVYLFFVLSGYLISGILLRLRDAVDSTDMTVSNALKTFYIRRALRIVPVYYLCLFTIAIGGSQEVRAQFWWHVTFNSNLLFSLSQFTELTAHFWTLAVEEQFYLFWPAIILLAPKKHMLSILVALIISALFYRLVVGSIIGFSANATGIITIACLDSFGAGALLAYAEEDKRLHGALLKFGLWSLPVPVFVAIWGTLDNGYVDNVARTLCAFAFAWIIASCGKAEALLGSWALAAIGVRSYGMYVFHLPVGWFVARLYYSGFHQVSLPFALATTMTIAIASVSWKLFEQPINSLKKYWPYATVAIAPPLRTSGEQ